MATHSSSLAREIPWTEEPGGLQSMGSQESDTTEIEPSAYPAEQSLPAPPTPRLLHSGSRLFQARDAC